MQTHLTPTTRAELKGLIRRLVIEQSGIDPATLTNDTEIATLGLDGVGVITLQMAIEDAFDLEMTESQLDALRTLQSIIDFVAAHLEI